MVTATLAFDPFQPEMLQKAFKAASPADRPALLSAATENMADGLRGISAVVRLVDDDPASFQAGLKLALQKNPRNLTAARALIWSYIRIGNYREAEHEYEIIERHWPQYNELIFEHLRVLLVGEAEKKLDYFLERGRFFKSSAASVSYALQVGTGDEIGNKARLLQLGRLAFTEMLNEPAAERSSIIQASDMKALWRFAAIVSTAESVAIIGNGPRLRGSRLGKEIDGYDVVIRCNFAEIEGFAEDVGSKTSALMFNESLRPRIPRLRARSPCYEIAPALGLHPEAGFGLTTEDFVSYPHTGTLPPATRRFLSEICYSRSTTGLMAINLLLFVFRKPVTIYGFDFFSDVSKPHYFDNQIGAYLGHELQYERWFVQAYVSKTFGDLLKCL